MKTMNAKLLELLRRRWVSPLVALSHVGCLSLSQRCGEYRRDGITVLDRWAELPNGKRVKEYKVIGL